jgi:hypothetical protein
MVVGNDEELGAKMWQFCGLILVFSEKTKLLAVLLLRFSLLFLLISFYDAGYQRMSHNVCLIKIDKGDAWYVA